MKNRILTFIIGVLTGSIITILIFINSHKPMNIDKDFNKIPPNGEIREPNQGIVGPPEINRNLQNE
jgi:hypothetical protein